MPLSRSLIPHSLTSLGSRVRLLYTVKPQVGGGILSTHHQRDGSAPVRLAMYTTTRRLSAHIHLLEPAASRRPRRIGGGRKTAPLSLALR
ncbi:hypothetical protein Zmor_014469 [Zophobas morio]|uniref:Uncharacterized protein n=1 Tax=Zophobas morio TaxID=2755281 RepID=A0AA38IF70_9CUCU|nr:hypothetical protein Zmor_014469 [Zophobas morio]